MTDETRSPNDPIVNTSEETPRPVSMKKSAEVATTDAATPTEETEKPEEKSGKDDKGAAIAIAVAVLAFVGILGAIACVVVAVYATQRSYNHVIADRGLDTATTNVTVVTSAGGGDLTNFSPNTLVIYTDQARHDGVLSAGLILADGHHVSALSIPANRVELRMIDWGVTYAAAQFTLSTERHLDSVATVSIAEAIEKGAQRIVITADRTSVGAIGDAMR